MSLRKSFWRSIFILGLCVGLEAQGGRWRLGPENLIEPKGWGVTEKVAIGDGENRTWFWSSGWGISFYPGQDMPDAQTSKELRLGKTAGGKCFWGLTFHFSKPINRFRFTVPRCSNLELGSGDVYLQYSTDVDPKTKELWRHGVKSSGYQKGGGIEPKQLDWVELPKPVNVLRMSFVFEGFVGNMQFYDGVDDGGVLEYGVPVLPVEQMTTVQMIPDARRAANVYRTGEALRAFIEVGPKLLAEAPVLVAADLGRGGERIFPTSVLGTGYLAELSDLPAGIYQLRIRLKSEGQIKTANGPRIIRVHPARVLTWAQTRQSPFGIVAIDGVDRLNVLIDGPKVGRLTGIHRLRGGSTTWCLANPAPNVYNLGGDRKEQTLEDIETGFIRGHSLAFSPGWTVDEKRQKPGDWGGHYPPKPEHLKDYAEYCRRLATLTKGWYEPEFEIWNEPNSMPYGSFKGTFDEFVALCRTAAETILAVNPQARMILGTCGDTDLAFIERLLRAGLSKTYRLVDIHPYRHTNQGPEDGLLMDINRLKHVINKYGDKQGIVFSETGWPTDPHYTGGNACYEPVSYYQQACFFSRTMLISVAAGVERVNFHILTDWASDNPKDAEANFGLIDARGEPKHSLCGLATTARHMEQTKFLGMMKGLPGYHYAWVWQTPWEKDAALLTVWCDTAMVKKGEIRWVPLPGEPSVAEDLWGERPGQDRLRKVNGRWEVLPGEDPIFIYLPIQSAPKDLAPLPFDLRPWQHRKITASVVKDKPMTIDGDLADWKELPFEISIGRNTGAGAMGFAGIQEGGAKKQVIETTSRFGVAYNDQGLFLAVHVRTDKPMKNDHELWWVWAGDCVRLFMGTVSSREFPYMSENQFQFALAPVTKGTGPAQVVNIGYETPRKVGMGDLIPGAKLVSKAVKDGWVVEALVPWDYFGKRPKAGEVWGFDIEAGGLMWNGAQDDWTNPLRWGELEF
jgi:hypothetical protein